MAETTDTHVMTDLVRFSYPNVFVARAAKDGEKAKYGVALLIPKSNKTGLKKLEKAIEAARQAGKGLWGGKIPALLKLPLRDGDIEKPDDAAYAGMMFLNANSDRRPGIIDANRDDIIDADDFKAGDWGRVTLNFYPFKGKSNGVAAGLGNIQKLKDGEALAGGKSAQEDFADAPDYDQNELDAIADQYAGTDAGSEDELEDWEK